MAPEHEPGPSVRCRGVELGFVCRQPGSACYLGACGDGKQDYYDVLGGSGEIGAGTLIDYRLRLDGIPIGWRSHIASWDPPRTFVDTQVKGPYKLWHHTHEFVPIGAGTLMRDTVRYQLHAGWLGNLAAGRKVASYVERIFDYRARKIDEMFGR